MDDALPVRGIERIEDLPRQHAPLLGDGNGPASGLPSMYSMTR